MLSYLSELIVFRSVFIFQVPYQIGRIERNTLLLLPCEMLALQTLQVAIGQSLFSNLKYFHTADIFTLQFSHMLPQILLSIYNTFVMAGITKDQH